MVSNVQAEMGLQAEGLDAEPGHDAGSGHETHVSTAVSRIQQLDAHVINKIAAGEVIERPASVVKELLENSVDALSTRIEVDVVEGGTELIRVVDDGEGIHPDDLLLAVSSHATSKIADADDLFRVHTLGFRGEALASIAEVSRFRIRSRTAECATGHELEVLGGVYAAPRTCGCPQGTLIEVAELFTNTPVRRKFMKTTATEFGHISEQFTRIALAHPRLHMVLRHNRNLVYELPATEQLLDRIRLFFGADLADHLIRVESAVEDTRIWGYVAHPAESKATRKGQYLFLNGRYVQDRSLQHALTEAYRGLLMVGRNPIAFLFLEMPANQVDVNVHPTKSEVRFREGQKLYRQLLAALRTKFLGMNLDSSLKIPGGAAAFSTGGGTAPGTGCVSMGGAGSRLEFRPAMPAATPDRLQIQQDFIQWAKSMPAAGAQPAGFDPSSLGPAVFDPGVEADESAIFAEPRIYTRAPDQAWPEDVVKALGLPAEAPEGVVEDDLLGEFPGSPSAVAQHLTDHADAARVFPAADSTGAAGPASAAVTRGEFLPETNVRAMQIHDSYLVVETTEGLTVVDQHALHERVMYEHLRNRVLAGHVESQRLLLPETIELSASEASLIRDHAELLAQCGLGVEGFGGNTVLVTSYPVMLKRADPVQIVREVAERLAGSEQGVSRRDLLDSLLHMMSCKAAIKAGQRLSPEEIESLLAQRHLIDDAHHCPHGRPTALVLSRAELDRQFGRMG